MQLIDKFKRSRRRARKARLRREIDDLQSLINQLSPNYDDELIARTAIRLTMKRNELLRLEAHQEDTNV